MAKTEVKIMWDRIKKILQPYICGRQPHFKFKETYDISGSELRRVISSVYPNARIYIADAIYKYVSYDELVRWLNEDSLDQMRWVENIWDCDNFAVESYCRAHKAVGNLAYGECWGNTPIGYHAFCLAHCDGKIKIIEPQNDDTKDWKKSDYKPDIIKI